MIYRGYLIQARVETWDSYEVNDDGTLGDFIGDGGGDADYPLFDVWTLDDSDPEDVFGEDCVDDTLESFEAAKALVDKLITDATTFAGEAGN